MSIVHIASTACHIWALKSNAPKTYKFYDDWQSVLDLELGEQLKYVWFLSFSHPKNENMSWLVS